MVVAAPELGGATEDESQFRIEATGALREPRTRILKHGETFAVAEPVRGHGRHAQDPAAHVGADDRRADSAAGPHQRLGAFMWLNILNVISLVFALDALFAREHWKSTSG